MDAFRQELSKLGWIEGKNITIEYRFAEQKSERLPELAADLVRLKVDLIVTTGDDAGVSGEESDHYHPHRDGDVSDPVGVGLVASLARPGGNVTGLSSLADELNTKRLEILKDAIPSLPSWVSAAGREQIGQDLQLKEIRPAAVALKLKLEEIETQTDAKGLESAFKPQSRSRSTQL